MKRWRRRADAGDPLLVIWLPLFADARRDPAFKDLVRDLGLVDYWRASGDWSGLCRPLGEIDFECG